MSTVLNPGIPDTAGDFRAPGKVPIPMCRYNGRTVVKRPSSFNVIGTLRRRFGTRVLWLCAISCRVVALILSYVSDSVGSGHLSVGLPVGSLVLSSGGGQ